MKKPKKAVKRVVKKAVKKAIKQKPIGKITHYFGGIKVAVIKLKDALKEGDVIRITGGENTDFEQKVKSMQLDYKKIKKAKPKESIGLKVSKKVREGYQVFKM